MSPSVLRSSLVFAEGTTIGAYQLVSVLGRGGMGTVYLGEHTLLKRKAAIKVLLPALSADTEIVQRLFNEARAVTQIADPGIVQVFDFGQDPDGSAYIVMELLEGETVAERIERTGHLVPLDVVRLMRLICGSLAAAHAKGIVHRDLKPENIFIVADPAVATGERAKIVDFGIAKLSRDEGTHITHAGAMLGTPLYMSPEQCRGAGEIDHRSDIYSIACVMVMMLTGKPPFDGDGTGDLIVAHLQEPPPRLTNVNAAIDHVVQRCLAKDPDDRYQTMTDLVAALALVEEQLQDASFEGRSSYAELGPPRSSRKRGAVVGGIAAFAIVAGIAGFAIATHGRDTQASTPGDAPLPTVTKAQVDFRGSRDAGLEGAIVDAEQAAITPADASLAVDTHVDATVVPHLKQPTHRFGGSHVRTTPAPPPTTASDVDRGD